GDARRDRLNALSMGSKTRQTVFGAMASVFDQIQKAKKDKNAAVQAEKELEYDKLKAQIEETNISADAVASALTSPDGQKKLAEFKTKYADFPARVKAIDDFAKAHADYQSSAGALEDANDLKRLLRGSGVLEFHILVDYDHLNPPPQVREMLDRLQKRGPIVQAGDTMRWYVADRPEEFKDGIAYNGKTYLLAWTTGERSMTNRPGLPAWALARSRPGQDPNNSERIVSFEFDNTGARLFGELSGN